jgi:hypothetical protein
MNYGIVISVPAYVSPVLPSCRQFRQFRHFLSGQLSGLVGTCRDLSGPVGSCRELSGPVGTCRELSGVVGTCRDLSGPVGTCRDFVGTCRELSGLRLFRAAGSMLFIPMQSATKRPLEVALTFTVFLRWRIFASDVRAF